MFRLCHRISKERTWRTRGEVTVLGSVVNPYGGSKPPRPRSDQLHSTLCCDCGELVTPSGPPGVDGMNPSPRPERCHRYWRVVACWCRLAAWNAGRVVPASREFVELMAATRGAMWREGGLSWGVRNVTLLVDGTLRPSPVKSWNKPRHPTENETKQNKDVEK